jgi:hypothetical protein
MQSDELSAGVQSEVQIEPMTESQAEQPANSEMQFREASADSRRRQREETQLAAIRELMDRALGDGAWLTLGEIAQATEFGEASVSAQLRHLRKSSHGRYRVEKRRRRIPRTAAPSGKRVRRTGRVRVIWEYRVLPPA